MGLSERKNLIIRFAWNPQTFYFFTEVDMEGWNSSKMTCDNDIDGTVNRFDSLVDTLEHIGNMIEVKNFHRYDICIIDEYLYDEKQKKIAQTPCRYGNKCRYKDRCHYSHNF